MTREQTMTVLALVVTLVLVPNSVLGRYGNAKRTGVQPGCCPPSFTANIKTYNGYGDPGQYDLVKFYWDADNSRGVSEDSSTNFLQQNGRSIQIDTKDDCVISDLIDSSDLNLEDFMCLRPDVVYDGRRIVELADGSRRLADVYIRKDRLGTDTLFYDPDDTNCYAFAAYFKMYESNALYGSVVEIIEFGKPPESVFRVPDAKCSNAFVPYTEESSANNSSASLTIYY